QDAPLVIMRFLERIASGMSVPKPKTWTNNKVWKDLAITFVAAVVVFWVAVRFDSFERLAAWSARYNSWQVNEVAAVLVFLAFALASFSWRRCRELKALERNITERKRAAEALRRAERKYREIFENAGEGIFQTTPDGKFITANPALARILGFDSPEELIAARKDIAREHYVDPQRRDDFKRLLDVQGFVRDFEFEAYRKDGARIWVSENVRSVRDESGAVFYFEGTSQDITHRKRAEESLHESEERFRQL